MSSVCSRGGSKRGPRAAVGLFCFLAAMRAVTASPCVEFENPATGAHLSAQSCTLSVRTCDQVRYIVFKVRYWSNEDQTQKLVTLGNITRPPFKLVWDLSGLSNQLGEGMTLFAEAQMKDGTNLSRKQEGIFLTHRQITTPVYPVSYRPAKGRYRARAIVLKSLHTSADARAFAGWNEQGLHIHIDVRDPLFYTSIPESKLSRMRVEVLVDPQRERSPYLTEKVRWYSIPLRGSPERILARPDRAPDGSFEIQKTSVPCSLETSVTKKNFKGYTVDCVLPWSDFGDKRNRAFGFNILASALDKRTAIQNLTWTDYDLAVQHAPYVWAQAKLNAKPLLANAFLLWLACCLIGLVAGAAGALVYRNLTRHGSAMARFEQSEDEERLYEGVKSAIQEQVTNPGVTLEHIAERFAVAERKVNYLFRRNHGESFKSYLMRARIEIAKERLRSSHSSEASIATSCGFANMDEMEKYFRKFCRTTPYKFREEYQVT